jgi:hypothetical protein
MLRYISDLELATPVMLLTFLLQLGNRLPSCRFLLQ